MRTPPWMKRLITCVAIASASIWLFTARESLASTPGLGAGLPDELGTFNVGHTTMSIVGEGTLKEPRPIDVDVWYPADKKAWDAASPSQYTSRLNGVPLNPTKSDPPKWAPLSWVVVSEVAREGAAFDKLGPFPVVLFSSGANSSAIIYAPTLEQIASHGYVVVAVSHNGDNADDSLIDFINTTNKSKFLNCLDNGPSPCLDPMFKNIADRARDVSKVLDTLPVAFGDYVNMSEVIAMGHSRGTVTSLGAGGGSKFFKFEAEPRVKAILGLSQAMPALILNLDLDKIPETVPVVLVVGGNDSQPTSLLETVFTNMTEVQDKAFIVIKNAHHRHFTSGFCPQVQAAGSVVLADLTRQAILDRRTLDISMLPSLPTGTTLQVCGFDYFTQPIDIRSLISDATVPPGFVITPDSVPTSGLDPLEANRLIGGIAITFFDSVVKALRHQEQPCADGPCANARFNRLLSDKFILKKEPNVSTAVTLTDEDMKQLDCREDCAD